jgi:hypothetical protein
MWGVSSFPIVASQLAHLSTLNLQKWVCHESCPDQAAHAREIRHPPALHGKKLEF